MRVHWISALAALAMLAATPTGGQERSEAQEPGNEETVVVEPHEHDDPSQHQLRFYESVDVSDRADNLVGIAASANQGTTGREDLDRRPRLRAGDLVETVPGAVATQHSGGGKANQYFLRGFNLDHGTDFAVSVARMPVNMPTHGHGQGYADLNFLIPELVERAHFRKGPYFAEVGDFSAAGGVGIGLRADYYGAEVKAFRSVNSGSADEWMLNPKMTLVWSPKAPVELYANAGSGFHSNDARGATIRVDPVTGELVEPVDPLVRAKGLDLGLRVFTHNGYHTSVSLFWLALDSELLFIGDAGATEASRPSRVVFNRQSCRTADKSWSVPDSNVVLPETSALRSVFLSDQSRSRREKAC